MKSRKESRYEFTLHIYVYKAMGASEIWVGPLGEGEMRYGWLAHC